MQGFSNELTTETTPSSSGLGTQPRSLAEHAAELGSDASANRLRAENANANASARQVAVRELELSQGVDTDQELQLLLEVEHAYEANARVIQVVDELLQTILNI